MMAVAFKDDDLAPPAIMDHERPTSSKRLEDLGLGRGVNAKDPKPWLNRSSFQVRTVTEHNIIGTDEGGAVQSHETEIHSSFALQTELQASIAFPQAPITIGVGAELSRGVTTWRKVVGERVLNRTISFLSNFEDSVPLLESQRNGESKAVDEALTFECRLCKWILDHIKTDSVASKFLPGEHCGKARETQTKTDAVVLLEFVAQSEQEPTDETGECPIRGAFRYACREFINTFNITHYVSAIRLGALRYDVYTGAEYDMKLETKSSAEATSIGGGSASTKTTWHKSSKQSKSKTIGRISQEGTVKRGSSDEAVVEVKITPIISLIKNPNLQKQFKIELEAYVEELQGLNSGPFYIATDSQSLFLQVDEDNFVRATTDINEASFFYITPTNDEDHPNEFQITYKPSVRVNESTCRQLGKQELEAGVIPLYLNAPIKLGVCLPGPLQLQSYVKEKNSRFMLVPRVCKGCNPVGHNTAPWTTHHNTFFIKCARRGFGRKSYLAVKHQGQTVDEKKSGVLWCVTSRQSEYRKDTSMLFRVLPKRYYNKVKDDEKKKA